MPRKAFTTAVGVFCAAALVVLYVIRPAEASPVPPALSALKANPGPRAIPATHFVDAQGRPVPLAAFKGKVVILDFWATWCAPCVNELPAVGRLAAALGDGKIAVVAVNADHKDAAAVARFLKAHGAGNLAVYRDPDLSLLTAFGAQGLPFSVLIDGKGREFARASGPMRWDDPAAIAYFKALAAAS